jgi:hypothetical protein
MSFKWESRERQPYTELEKIKLCSQIYSATMAMEGNMLLQVTSSYHTSRVIHAMLGQQTFDDVRKLQDKQEHTTNGFLNTCSSGEVSLHKVRFDRDANVMDDWHNEWKTAPSDPLPLNLKPLLL